MSLLVKTEAIVLHRYVYSESSYIVRLFRPSGGPVSVIAKGARRKKSRFSGMIEPLNRLEIIFNEKENRDLHTLNQCNLVKCYDSLHQNLLTRSTALCIAEILMKTLYSGEDYSKLYQFFVQTLEKLNRGQGSRCILIEFMLGFTEELGLGDPSQYRIGQIAQQMIQAPSVSWEDVIRVEEEFFRYLKDHLDLRTSLKSMEFLIDIRKMSKETELEWKTI